MDDQELALTAMETCLGIKSVSKMGTIISDTLKVIPGFDSRIKGVKIDHDNGATNIALFIRVRYGESIPAIAWNVQSSVKDALKEHTDDLGTININVQGVDR